MAHKYNNKSLVNHIKSATAWSAICYVTAAIATFAHIAVLSRNLPATQLGVYFLFFSFAVLCSTISCLGLPEALIKFVAKHQRQDAGQIGAIITRTIDYCAIGFLGVVLILFLFGKNILFDGFDIHWNPSHLILLCIWFVLLGMQSVQAAIFRAKHNIKLATFFANTLRNSLYLVTTCVVLLFRDELDLTWVLYCVVVSVFINNVAALVFLRSSLFPARHQKLQENLLSLSLPLLGNLLIQILVARVGIWALGLYSTKDVVAVYGAAVQVAALITMPLLVINSMAMPLIADMYHNQNDTVKLQRVLRTVTTTVSIPIILLYVLLVLFGTEMLVLFFGEHYRIGYWILILLATGQVGNMLAGPCGLILKMTGQHHTLLKLNYLVGGCAVLATFVAAKYFGEIGVALVAMITFLSQNAISLWLSISRSGVNTALFIDKSSLLEVFTNMMRIAKGVLRTIHNGVRW